MTTDALQREMEAEQAAVMRALLDDLNELALINDTMSPLTARKAVLTERIKQGMGLQDLTELADGETGVAGRIQERTSAPTYDLTNANMNDLAAAGAAGMLRLDHVMFDRFRKQSGAVWADQLARLAMPGSLTTALTVEKKK